MWRPESNCSVVDSWSTPAMWAGVGLFLLSLVALGACEAQKSGPTATSGQATTTDSNRWQIVSVAGDSASWRRDGGPWRRVMESIILFPGSELKLGLETTATLDSGGDRIVVAENTEIAIPTPVEGSRVKRIIQSIGTMLLRVETREKGGFQVKTPYLVATVKGTEFGVTVGEVGASVSVSEGVVGVDAGDGSPEVDATPGQTASVSPGTGPGVSLGATPAGSVPAGLVESMGRRAEPALDAPVGPGANRGKGNVSPGTSNNAGGKSSGNSNAGGNSGGNSSGGNSGGNAGGNSAGNSNAGGNAGGNSAGNSNAGGNAGGNSAGNSNAGGNGGGKGNDKK